jgi:5-methylcytosine-specific restriction endonuclease McrBC regulatory subunit McrC
MNLELKDSQYLSGEDISLDKKSHVKNNKNKTALYCQVVDKLNKDIKNGKVEFFSFSNLQKKQNLEDRIIWFEINNTRESHSNTIVTSATFFTSHYIGFYSTKISNQTISIYIEPRFGNGLLNYLLSYTYGVYLPKGFSNSNNQKSQSLWLITFMWKALLQKAMTKSQIPKEYKKFSKNLSTFKGQLNIQKQIKHNLFDRSRFYCDFRKLTMDTTINQTIRFVYKLLKKEYGHVLKDISEYDLMLQSFGVENSKVNIKQIQNIRYSKLNFHYKKVMELSALLIKQESKTSDIHSNTEDSFAYFIDIAELWENYLLKILQKGLSEYYIYSPNEKGGENLFSDGSRSIRPDIIIEKNGKIVAILDAKYKWYKKIGTTACDIDCISRDDLYQMTTYLYHYGKNAEKLIGLFISPVRQEKEDLKVLYHNKNHKIGVVNLNIDISKDQEFDKNEIQFEENNFIKKIRGILK